MKRERRQPTRRELAAIIPKQLVIRRIVPAEKEPRERRLVLDDPIKIEAAGASINAFIEKRAKQSTAERERENLWAQSVRRHHEKRRQANRLAWLDYHQGQAARLRATRTVLVAKHEEVAERLQHEFQERRA